MLTVVSEISYNEGLLYMEQNDYSNIFLEGLRITTKYLSRDSRSPDPEFKLEPTQYESMSVINLIAKFGEQILLGIHGDKPSRSTDLYQNNSDQLQPPHSGRRPIVKF
jgi:hypothetical protein